MVRLVAAMMNVNHDRSSVILINVDHDRSSAIMIDEFDAQHYYTILILYYTILIGGWG